MAEDQRYATAQSNLGSFYANDHGLKNDFSEAARWCRKAADQANAEAQFSLGSLYFVGQGVMQDFSEAARWC